MPIRKAPSIPYVSRLKQSNFGDGNVSDSDGGYQTPSSSDKRKLIIGSTKLVSTTNPEILTNSYDVVDLNSVRQC